MEDIYGPMVERRSRPEGIGPTEWVVAAAAALFCWISMHIPAPSIIISPQRELMEDWSRCREGLNALAPVAVVAVALSGFVISLPCSLPSVPAPHSSMEVRPVSCIPIPALHAICSPTVQPTAHPARSSKGYIYQKAPS